MSNIDTLIEEIKGRHICRPRNQAEMDRNFLLVDLEIAIKQMLDGYAIVPIEPTGYMIAEGLDEFNIINKSAFEAMGASYKAMITAKGESND